MANIIMLNGVAYSSTPSSASAVPYSNTTSGLSSLTVQGAIDELDTSLDTAKSNISTIMTPIAGDYMAIVGSYGGGYNKALVFLPPHIIAKYNITCSYVNCVGVGSETVGNIITYTNCVSVAFTDATDRKGFYAVCTLAFAAK